MCDRDSATLVIRVQYTYDITVIAFLILGMCILVRVHPEKRRKIPISMAYCIYIVYGVRLSAESGLFSDDIKLYDT